ncbi:unnamed protein product, partial [Thlaspi arvense]
FFKEHCQLENNYVLEGSPTQKIIKTTALLRSKHWRCLPPVRLGAGTIFPWIMWAIWISINYLIFEKRIFTAEETITKALQDAREWQLAQGKEEIRSDPTRQLIASPPISDELTCNTDAAWRADRQVAGLGWIFRIHEDTVISQDSQAIDSVASPLMAEALAIFYALQKASQEGWKKLKVLSDSQILIGAINSNMHQKEIYGVVFDIKHLSAFFECISFQFVARTSNVSADVLAKRALQNYCTSLNPAH